MMFNDTITIYNSYEQDFKKVLVPTVLRGVHAEMTVGASAAADGDRNTSSLTVIIPFQPHKNTYVTAHEYDISEDKYDKWTLFCGDVIAIGDTGAAKDYAELATRVDVFRITSVKTLGFGGLPHWEVHCS